jgi:hypothetical protein
MLLAARALGLDATLTTLYLQFEKEVEAALGLPPGVHSYALVPIGYPMGRFAVLPSLMSSMKIDGARLTEICSDGKLGVCCSRFGGREEFTPRVPVYLDRMSRR